MLYTVGEISKETGLPASTLRYYDKEGLLLGVERSPGGIRMFTEQDYEWLKVIGCLKRSGLSIQEIKAYLEMVSRGDESLQERFLLFHARREAVRQQMREMQQTLDFLEYKCWFYEQAMQDGTANRVSSLTLDELPEQFRAAKEKMTSRSSEK